MNGYELVDKWVKEEKRYSFPQNMFQSKDEKIALEILKQYYKARYEPSDDYHYCGIWYIDNPYHPKSKGYSLRYRFKKSDKWEKFYGVSITNFPLWEKSFAEEIYRLDNCKESKEEIAKLIAQNFYYVGKERVWEVIETEFYI